MNQLFKIFRDKTVFITGHTGFKGSWLSLWLTGLGAKVIGYALDPYTPEDNFVVTGLKDMLIDIRGDIREIDRLQKGFGIYKPEIVFHLAAQPLVRLSYEQPRDTYEINIMGTVNVLECIRHSDSVRAGVMVTSDKCYENKRQIWGYRETDRMGGYDPYSSSKGSAELLTASYRSSFFNPQNHDIHGVGLASARAGNVIGGGDWAKDRLVPDCMRALLKGDKIFIRNPGAIRPWQHVLEPLCGYMTLAAKLYENGPEYAEAWNFGPDDKDAKPVEWIVKKICEKWGAGSTYSIDEGIHPYEAECLKLDCSKAKRRLGWCPGWNLDQAIDKVIEWTRAFREGSDLRHFCTKQIAEYEGTYGRLQEY